jgi:hypothetical protein
METSMLTRSILFAVLAACGVNSSGAASPKEPPEKKPPADQGLEGQHFCCTSVSPKDFTGDGCVAVSKEQINSCDNVLYCSEGWVKSEGKVACD